MQNDRQITISVGNSRRATNWQTHIYMLSEFYERLRIPVRSTESMQEYLTLSKAEQDEKKDIGGFVAGEIKGPRRKANAVKGRDLITLDLDNIPPGETDDVLKRVEALGCNYCIYSTRKHTPAVPRLRVLIPLDRTATPDEYEPLARYMASLIGIEYADPTTFEVSRMMYWPSTCTDSKYVYYFADKPMASIEGLLKRMSDKYGDWREVANWPQVPGSENLYRKLAIKQIDPLTKSGVVGSFCHVYDIYGAMETFLNGIYAATNTPGRYTYLGGSTAGGAVVYQDGKFLYSHHATDPCCGRLVNAFDLVRLHKFSDLDDTADPKTPTNRLPSYTAMSKLAISDQKVSTLLAEERAATAMEDFGQFKDGAGWASRLELNSNSGSIKPTIDNMWLILENDANLKNKFALNEFAGRAEVLGKLPWNPIDERRLWTDNDNQGLYWYFEKFYNLTGTTKIDSALSLHSERHKFNEVKNYLLSIIWDNVPRLDTLFIDYLGAKDTEYIRAATRKAFVAAVARVFNPGCKYDTMLILSGPQGIGKSSILDKMSRGWFNDSIRTFEGKEASELLQGVWIVEIGELDAFKRSDVSRIKQFLSQRSDRFRQAYGRHVKEIPRRCVFFGTTNSDEYLRDKTGNRRFWPIDVGINPVTKNIWSDLEGEIDQIWSEAVLRYKLGENINFMYAIEEEKEAQESHRERSVKEGIIAKFIERPVPEDWIKWSLNKRLVFLNGELQGITNLVPRDRICAAEIWCEAFNGQIKDLKRSDSIEINEIMRSMPGWVKSRNPFNFGDYGNQRGFKRV